MSGRSAEPGAEPPRPAGDRFTVRLEVDGIPLPLKPFLHDLIGGALDGLVRGLRGVDDPRRIQIDVERT